MIWTIAWIGLTIFAWKYWRWKALIPYTSFLIISVVMSTWAAISDVPERNINSLRAVLNVLCFFAFVAVFGVSKSKHDKMKASLVPVEYECDACKVIVSESATVCPNCGEKLED